MLLDAVKTALRITAEAFDEEITGLMEAARLDLRLSGVTAAKLDESAEDPLINQAVTVYCKAHFGLNNEDSEKYQRVYDLIKVRLTLAAEYTEVPEDV